MRQGYLAIGVEPKHHFKLKPKEEHIYVEKKQFETLG